MQKGRISVFGRFSFFCRIELIFHRLTCFDMKHDGQFWVFFLPLTSQRRLESSDENEIWHEYSLRKSLFNGNSLTSLTDIVTSQLMLIFETEIWN